MVHILDSRRGDFIALIIFIQKILNVSGERSTQIEVLSFNLQMREVYSCVNAVESDPDQCVCCCFLLRLTCLCPKALAVVVSSHKASASPPVT